MGSPDSVAEVGEDALVAAILARFGAHAPELLVGPGDDAAVLALPGGHLAISTDTLVEGTDFRRDWSGGADVGVKVAAQGLADIAAMGARPLALLVSLATPGELPVAWAEALATGLDDECRRAGADVVGGDVSGSDQMVVTGTALGLLDGVAPVLRKGARPGDTVALSDPTGGSAAGLALLQSGLAPYVESSAAPGEWADRLLRAHLAPRPRYAAGPAAAQAGAHCMIDISDGLLRDAARIAVASGVVLDLDPDALAPAPDLVAAASWLGTPDAALVWVLTGGEDHAMLACFDPGTVLPDGFRVVGRVTAAGEEVTGDASAAPTGHATVWALPAAPVVRVGGRAWAGPPGWRHFT